MPTLYEAHIACTFPDNWDVTKYDDWMFYRNRFSSVCGSSKAVDFLAYDRHNRTLWLIELKDYRQHRRTKDHSIALCDEIAIKVRDTLAGIFAAKVDSRHPEQPYADRVLSCTTLRAVLHLEQPKTPSRLYPRAYNPASIQQKLKQLLKPIDPHPKVVELARMEDVPWLAASHP